MIARFLGRVVARLVLTVAAVAVMVFFLLPLVPGDVVDAAIGQAAASEGARAQLRRELGLDDPLGEQFMGYMRGLLTLEFGTSWVSRQPVRVLLAQNLGATLWLAGLSFTLALGMGIGLAAAYRVPALSRIAEGAAVVMLSAPVLVVGLALIWVFAIALGVVGTSALVLPAVTLAIPSGGVIGRVLQTEMETEAAREVALLSAARGVGRARRVFGHVLPVAWVGASEVVGLQAAFLVGGTIVTETLFTRSGLGRLLVTAVLNKDVPVVQATVVTIAALYVVILQGVALSRLLLDPRAT